MKIQDRPDVQDFIRGRIAELLVKQCTRNQRLNFQRIFKCDPHDLPSIDLQTALDLVERTIAKNISESD